MTQLLVRVIDDWTRFEELVEHLGHDIAAAGATNKSWQTRLTALEVLASQEDGPNKNEQRCGLDRRADTSGSE